MFLNMSKRVVFLFLLGIALILIGPAYHFWPKQNSPQNLIPSATSLPIQQDEYVVQRVVDGDTIELLDGRKVRYIGVNTPETKDPRRAVQCFGKEAYLKNKELVEGKHVRLEKDVSETDKYGRLLRYVYMNDLFVNDYLVRNGFAQVSTYPPDVKFQEQFLQAQKEARENKRGLWSSCKP